MRIQIDRQERQQNRTPWENRPWRVLSRNPEGNRKSLITEYETCLVAYLVQGLQQGGRFVLTGGAESGKTAIMERVALEQRKAQLKALEESHDPLLWQLPLILHARKPKEKGFQLSLEEASFQDLGLKLPYGLFQGLCQSGLVTLHIDGLEEWGALGAYCSKPSHNTSLSNEILAFMQPFSWSECPQGAKVPF